MLYLTFAFFEIQGFVYISQQGCYTFNFIIFGVDFINTCITGPLQVEKLVRKKILLSNNLLGIQLQWVCDASSEIHGLGVKIRWALWPIPLKIWWGPLRMLRLCKMIAHFNTVCGKDFRETKTLKKKMKWGPHFFNTRGPNGLWNYGGTRVLFFHRLTQ